MNQINNNLWKNHIKVELEKLKNGIDTRGALKTKNGHYYIVKKA